MAVFHFAATRIASAFKGYYSRKYIHDFFARRAYVNAVAARGEQLRADLEIRHAAALAVELATRDAAARAEFDKATTGLHHLTSTAVQPGVYNPPWATRAADVPSAFGVPLEVHLRAAALRDLRTRGLYSRRDAALAAAALAAGVGGTTAASVTTLGHTAVSLVPAYASAASRASLQATAPYDAPRDAARREARVSKLANLDQKPLLAGTFGRVFGAPIALGVHASTHYTESWLASRPTRELEHQNKHLRVSSGGAPFVSSSSRASRLFEDTERRGAGRAIGLLVAPPKQQQQQQQYNANINNTSTNSVGVTLGATLGPSGLVTSVRVGDTVLRSTSLPNHRAVVVVGSAVAAARARALAVQEHHRVPLLSTTPTNADLSPTTFFLPAMAPQASSAIPRKRPLMKPIPGSLQIELPGGQIADEGRLRNALSPSGSK